MKTKLSHLSPPPFAVTRQRKEQKKKGCSSFNTLAENLKEEGRRKVEEIRPCM